MALQIVAGLVCVIEELGLRKRRCMRFFLAVNPGIVVISLFLIPIPKLYLSLARLEVAQRTSSFEFLQRH